METTQIVTGCITALIAFVLGRYVSFTVRGKGPILSNSYLWLTQAQKKRVDKKAEYKLVTVVFGCLCGAYVLLTINIFTGATWPMVLFWVLTAFAILYALVDAVKAVVKK